MVKANVPDLLALKYPDGIYQLCEGCKKPYSEIYTVDGVLKNNISQILKTGSDKDLINTDNTDNTENVKESFQLIKNDYLFRKVKISMSIVFLLVIFSAYLFRKIK